MIRQKFLLNRRFWKVYVCYNVSRDDIDYILHFMKLKRMPTEYIKDAHTMLTESKLNTAATYSNITTKTSIVIFLKTENKQEFVDSFTHEIFHLSNHIARAYGLNINGEEVCYIGGDVAKLMYKACHKLMCNCSRSHT